MEPKTGTPTFFASGGGRGEGEGRNGGNTREAEGGVVRLYTVTDCRNWNGVLRVAMG